MKKYFLFGLFIFFQSCSVIEINESGYRSLTYFEKTHVKPFESATVEKTCEGEGCLTIFEINSENIKSLLGRQEYTWVHIWNPYCSNESCINIEQYEKLENNYADNGLTLNFISGTYDLDHIASIAKKSNFSKTIYVLEGSYYGVKLKEIRKKLYEDINPNSEPDDYFFYDDFLFSGDSLIYMGDDINDSIFDVYLLKSTVKN